MLFPGSGETARLMRTLDWSGTDFGPTKRWPENLRNAVRLCLASRFPILIWWGPRLSVLYNDACIPFLGPTKHPRMLGRPGRECWSESWDTIGPMLEGVLASGDATWSEDFEYYFARRLPQEEVFVTFTYAPILAPDGARVDGVFCPCFETTERVVGARRLETLRRLGDRGGKARTVRTACLGAAAILRDNPCDVSFSAIYALDRAATRARLCAAVTPRGDHRLPRSVAVGDAAPSVWPLARVLRTKRAEEVDLLAAGLTLTGERWPEPVRRALVLAIPGERPRSAAGLLVVGIGPRRVLDVEYRTFLDLAAGHVGTALAEVRALEDQRRRAETLAELDRAKTALFSNISHEFRTPLTLMLGPLEDTLADDALPLAPPHRDRLQVVRRDGLRLLRLVNMLLDFSRIEAGRIEALFEPLDLADLTADLASTFRSACERAGLALVVDCPGMAAGRDEVAYVDRDMWETIVLNLISNAFKFTFEGSITVAIHGTDGRIELTVRDTGIGIPEADLPYLFERFRRVEGSHGRTSEGSGIGLSLVRELVELHGGTVAVKSAPEVGSTFTVSIPSGSAHLPRSRVGTDRARSPPATPSGAYVEEALRWLASEADVREDLAPAVTAPRAATVADHRPRVVWADDNADLREYVRGLLAPAYDVRAVPDGEAALQAAREQPPDLVLSDVMMPRMDGIELLRRLRADPMLRDVPVILLSGHAGEEAHVAGLAIGADDYLIKPFSARELLARVGVRLELTRFRRESERCVTRVLESISEGCQILSPDWHVLYLNPLAREGYRSAGMDPDWMIGRHYWDELYAGSLESNASRQLHRSMRERVTVTFENYDPAQDRWMHVRVDPLPDGGLACFFRDVTAQKKDEELRRRLQQERDTALARLSLQFERMPIGCIVFDAQFRILDWNPAAEAIFGFRREEVVGKDGPSVLVSPEVGVSVEDILARLSNGDLDAHSVNENTTKDGRTIVCEWHNTPLRDSDGTLIGHLSMTQDVTERRRAEEALCESEERYRALVSQVRDYAIFSMDDLGIITTWNEGCHLILGYPREEFVGMDAGELYTPEDRASGVLPSRMARVAETHAMQDERWMMARGGRRFFAMGAATALRDTASRLIGFSVMLRDVTQMKLTQDELAHHGERLARLVSERTDALEKATERLRASERMASLGTLAAGLGHDLGNLLLPLKARLQHLERAELQPELREHLTGIASCVEYLERLSGGLRLLVTGPTECRLGEPTELGAWWRDVKLLLKNVLPRHVTFAGGMPSAETWVSMDRAGLTQAMFNVVQNAADALRARERGLVTVAVEPGPRPATVVIRVTDDGPGMTEAVLDRCMELYFSTKPRDLSTGLGLALVSGLVTGVGGQLEIASAHGAGTTVRLILPGAMLPARPADVAPCIAVARIRNARTRSLVGAELRMLGFDMLTGTATDAPDLLVVDSAAPNRASGQGTDSDRSRTVMVAIDREMDREAIRQALRTAAARVRTDPPR